MKIHLWSKMASPCPPSCQDARSGTSWGSKGNRADQVLAMHPRGSFSMYSLILTGLTRNIVPKDLCRPLRSPDGLVIHLVPSSLERL